MADDSKGDVRPRQPSRIVESLRERWGIEVSSTTAARAAAAPRVTAAMAENAAARDRLTAAMEARGLTIVTPSPLDRPLSWTRFRSHGASIKEEATASLRELAELIEGTSAATKKALPWLKLATFGDTPSNKPRADGSRSNSLRHDANVLSVTGLEADYDAQAMTMEEAGELLGAAGVAAILYASPSARPTAPRWRVLVPLSAPVKPDRRHDLLARLNGVLGGALAGESFTLSQSYYFGRALDNAEPDHRVLPIDGSDFIDERPDLDAGARGRKGELVRGALAPAAATTSPATAPGKGTRREQLEANIRAGRELHESLKSLAGMAVAAGRDRSTVTDYLRRLLNLVPAALRSTPSDPTRWQDRWEGVPSLVDHAMTEEVAKQAAREAAEDAGLGDTNLTELGVAERLWAQHGADLRWNVEGACWHVWDGERWDRLPPGSGKVFGLAKAAAKELAQEGGCPNHPALSKASTYNGAERIAKAMPGAEVVEALWDEGQGEANAFLLGTPSGVVELRTGELRQTRREDYITRRTSVSPIALRDFDPDKHCPIWLRTLREIMCGDEGLVTFIQRWLGYSLTGDMSEHAFFFGHGVGRNGKGVVKDTAFEIMGSYALAAPMELLMSSKFDRHTTDKAMLRGARLIVASETQEGRAWNDVLIKELTGEDAITARLMRQDNKTFKPRGKLLIIGNNKPRINNVDEAMRRRINLVPFKHVIDEASCDPDLRDKLRAEHPGILAWMLRGCLDWQRDRVKKAGGLARPPALIEATAEYLASQDLFCEWLEQECETVLQPPPKGEDDKPLHWPTRAEWATTKTTTAELLMSWQSFAEEHGERGLLTASRAFADRLAAAGFDRATKVGPTKARGFAGIRLRPQDQSDWLRDGL